MAEHKYLGPSHARCRPKFSVRENFSPFPHERRSVICDL